MKRSRFSKDQIIGILKEHEAGISVADLCRKHGVSDATVYKWKAKYGGMDVSEAKRLKGLKDENVVLRLPHQCASHAEEKPLRQDDLAEEIIEGLEGGAEQSARGSGGAAGLRRRWAMEGGSNLGRVTSVLSHVKLAAGPDPPP